MRMKEKISTVCYHVLVGGLGFIMIYPLIWLLTSSFKETDTIFQTVSQLFPEKWVLDNYIKGWSGFGGYTFATFFKNTFFIAILATIGSLISSALVGYAFARCEFPGKKLLFAAMLVTMMLPAQVLMVPQYLWYQRLGWVGTYLPLIVPYWFAVQGFFVYLLTNFMKGIPMELDEAARIDGCSHWGIFRYIMLPLVKPAFITVIIFSFMWRWNDFMSALMYVNKAGDYTISIALKLFCDPNMGSDFGAMFAMSIASLVPSVLIFLFFQKYLADGVATTGLKG